uniref:Fanconi anemia group A n=1 Tax=Lygus hesperus TaxID=30085 RepID=A0A146MBE8_LYGHE
MDRNIVLRRHTEMWSSQKLNVGTAFSVAKMLSFLSPEVIISELKTAADLLPFRWKNILTVMSILVTEHNESASLLKGLIDSWLKTGLEENNKDSLFLALVATRHCCAEKTEQFPNYITWFGSAQPSSPPHFVTFFKFLTELVPHEPPLYLKIHVNKVPAAPSGCQTVLTDYIALAKTRLSDLNETTDYLSIFNKCHDTEEENHASDVLQLINHFKATNEIAKPIIEASVFRKQYYEKVFLKYLLKRSTHEDPTIVQVIHKLNSLGKIPPSLFDSWKSK